MTANRALMDKLGFALKHDGKEWLVIEDDADDRCATITEQVLWQALTMPGYLAAPVAPQHAPASPVAPAEPDKLRAALVKIDAIRNDIVGHQSIGWSRHIYPLVAALGEAGFEGEGYEAARAKVIDAPAAPAEPTHLRRVDGTLSGMFIEPATSEAAAVAADLRNWFDFLPGHAQPTVERAVRLLETKP
jgi:hypothetical protein